MDAARARRPAARALPAGLSTRERALYLQGVVLQHRRRADVRGDGPPADGPRAASRGAGAGGRRARGRGLPRPRDRRDDAALSAVRHRAPDHVGGHRGRRGTTIPTGSVLCFNYPDFHRAGFDDPDAFRPERWERPVAPRCRLHPVRRRGQPPVPGARDRAGHDAGGGPRGAAAVRARTPPPPTRARSRTAGRACSSRARRRGPAAAAAARCCSRSCGCATAGRTSGAASSSSCSGPTWSGTPAGSACASATSRPPEPTSPRAAHSDRMPCRASSARLSGLPLAATGTPGTTVIVCGTLSSPSSSRTSAVSAVAIGGAAGGGHDERVHRLPGPLVRRPDHVRLGHVGMARQHPLDRARVDHHRVDHDDVAGAADEVEEAVVVHVAEVAGAQPAVPQDVAGLLRVAPSSAVIWYGQRTWISPVWPAGDSRPPSSRTLISTRGCGRPTELARGPDRRRCRAG